MLVDPAEVADALVRLMRQIDAARAQNGWGSLFESLDMFSHDFMSERGQRNEQQKRDDAFE